MTARKPVVDLAALGKLPDEELERARALQMAALSPRQLAFVEAKLAGKTTVQAAEAAGYRSAKRMGFKVIRGQGVAEAIAIGREIANRRAGLSKEDVLFRLGAVYRAAVADRDWTNAVRTLETIARLGGYFPDQRIHLQLQPVPPPVSDEQMRLLSVLVHEVQPQLEASVEPAVTVEAVPALPPASALDEETAA